MRKPLVGFLVLAVTLALVQLYQLRNTMPPPDGIAYFEVADQIQLVGYARALDRELFRSAAGDALLLVTLCVTVGLAFRSIARLCWPGTPAAGHAEDTLLRRRAVWLVAAGFALVAVLSTAQHFRASERQGRAAGLHDAQAVSAALAAVPAGGRGLRTIAVAGDWLGVYGVRLSGSQVIADVPQPAVLHDRARAAAVVRALQERGVVALLVDRSALRPDDLLQPVAMTRQWAVVDVRSAPARPAGDARP